MDTDVINLAKAIRQKESGGDFNAVGDNGTSRGAYQWQDATWKGHAKQILGNANAEKTPANQNAVAYGMIKTWKDQGLNPAQIAAKWNSGSEKGWENKIGVTKINGKEIAYNVPAYVKEVTDTYRQFKGFQNPQATPTGVQPIPLEQAVSQQPKEQGFFSRLINDPIKTLVAQPAVKFGQVIGGGLINAFGTEEQKAKFAEEVQKPTQIPSFTGNIDILGQKQFGQGGGTQIAGQALESASYLAPVGGIAKTAESFAAGQFGKAALSGMATGAYGGALYGAGTGLQEDNPTLGSVAQSTALNSLGGALAGGALGVAIPGAIGLANQASRFRKPIITATEGKLEQQVGDFLKLTPKQIRIEERYAKNTPKFLVDEGVAGLIKSNGKELDTTEAVAALTQKSQAENKAFSDILAIDPRYTDFESMKQQAIKKAESQFFGTSRTKAINKITDEFNAYEQQFGSPDVRDANGNILGASSELNKAKQDAWSKTKAFGSPESQLEADVNYLIGSTLKDNIEKLYGDDVAIKDLNKRLGDFSAAIKLLENRNGTKLPGGMLSRAGFRIAGAVTARGLGPLGEVAGAITGGRLAEILQDPQISTYMARKILEKIGKQKGGSIIIQEAERIMQMKAEQALNLKRLPGPSTPGTERQPFITPPPKTPTTYEAPAKQIGSFKS